MKPTPNRFRMLLAAFALLSVCVFAGSTLIPTHWHSSAVPDACAICHAGHLVFAPAAEAPAVWPPEQVSTEVHAPVRLFETAGIALATPSRGPPQA